MNKPDDREFRGNYIRRCMFCDAPTGEPLKVEGKLYKFCCPEHKNAWDYARKSVTSLSEKDWES